MEIFAAVLMVGSLILAVLAVIAVVFFAGTLAYAIVADRREKAVEPEPEPFAAPAPATQRVAHAA